MDSKINYHIKSLRAWSFIGLLLSIYATYVELKAENDDDYVAMCDISPIISCTDVFTSSYGRGFGIIQMFWTLNDYSWIPPNGIIGTCFYGFLTLITFRFNLYLSYLVLLLALCSTIVSIYLGFLLFFILKNFCFICVAIYAVNHQILKHGFKLSDIKCEQVQQQNKMNSLSNEEKENSIEKKEN